MFVLWQFGGSVVNLLLLAELWSVYVEPTITSSCCWTPQSHVGANSTLLVTSACSVATVQAGTHAAGLTCCCTVAATDDVLQGMCP